MSDMDRKEVIDIYRRLRTVWEARNVQYDISRQRYDGRHWDPETNPEPTNRYSLTLNYMKPFVDKSVQLLVGRMPAIQVMPSGTDEVARRHAEQLEGVLYGTWDANDAPDVFWKTAWDSFVLRRGIIYTWWDAKNEMVRFKNCTPDHFFPEYDGDDLYRCIYVSRRNTERLKELYPDHADEIKDDPQYDYGMTANDDPQRANMAGQTTVYDMFEYDGTHVRVMGDWVQQETTDYPWGGVPFIEFPCFPRGGQAEPLNMIDQLVELNQYLDQIVSQKADIIARYANPTILDYNSGQSPEDIRRSVAAQGAVIPIRRDGDVRLLNWQGTVPAIDEQITLILDTMFDLAGKPRSAFGQSQTNQSGIQTNLTLTPTLQSNESHETIWGKRLSQLNRYILLLWEKNMNGAQIEMSGRYGMGGGSQKLYDVSITGKMIQGWTKNRIKWPSSIRTDDPVYVQNHLQQLQATPFPAISLYTYLEDMNTEDVEAEIDRISLQLEDPRFHPDRMTAATNAMSALSGQAIPGATGAPPPPASPPGATAAATSSYQSAGVPAQDALAKP